MAANTRSSSVVPTVGGSGRIVCGTSVGRKRPASGSPSATAARGGPARCSASARLSVWTNPPRGLVEWRERGRSAGVTASQGSVAAIAGSRRAIAAAASEARAAVSVTRQPAVVERLPLGGEALRVAARCRARRRRPRAAGRGDLRAHRRQLRGRVRVRPVAEHDVEDDRRDVRLGALPPAAARSAPPDRSSGAGGPWCTPPRPGRGRCGRRRARAGRGSCRAGCWSARGRARRRARRATRSRACRRRTGRAPACARPARPAICRADLLDEPAGGVGRGAADGGERGQHAGLQGPGDGHPVRRGEPRPRCRARSAPPPAACRPQPPAPRWPPRRRAAWTRAGSTSVPVVGQRARPARSGPSGRRPRAVRSRPPSPITCETPRPSGRAAPPPPARRCRPRRRTADPARRDTTLANPRHVRPSIAVPAPGPITSRPSRAARVLERDLGLDGARCR